MKTNSLKFRILFEYLPMTITGLGAFISGVIFKSPIMEILPIFITLFVMLFNSRANRIGFIIGGCNCFLYFISFMMQQLYKTLNGGQGKGITYLDISIESHLMSFAAEASRLDNGQTKEIKKY